MTKFSIVSSREVIRALKRAGFKYAPKRGKGSHIAMMTTKGHLNPRLVIVPERKNLPKGTLHSILDQAGLTKKEFIKLINE